MERLNLHPKHLALEVGTMALKGLHFVGQRLAGGGWAELPFPPQGPVRRPERCPKPPVMASITYISTTPERQEPPDLVA